MSTKSSEHWLRVLAHGGALLPAAYLLWQLVGDRFLVDPVKETTIRTGRLAITFLLLSLSCTPLHTIFGFRSVLQLRRPLGLYSAAYALAHFLTFAVWDYRLKLNFIWDAVLFQRYIVPGAVALAVLLVLAATSLRRLRVALGKRWKPLQRGVYLAAGLVVLHVLWAAKSPLERPGYAILLAVLLLLRVPPLREGIVRVRRWLVKRVGAPRSVHQPPEPGSEPPEPPSAAEQPIR